MTPDLTAGLLTGMSLIVAIGAQNAYVLRQGLAKDHVGITVAICVLSDLLLLTAGIAGIGTIADRAPWAVAGIKWFGVAFLSWYGASSLRRARKPSESLTADDAPPAVNSARKVALTTLALTWLNPHVYLDTVLLIGSIANQHGPVGRWWFAAGAAIGSAAWFTGLGYGSRALSGILTSPRSWQVLDAIIGLTMLTMAAKIALG